MNINFERLSASERYFAMVQTIIPRPIAWVLSDNGIVSKEGVVNKNGDSRFNLAPYSFFTGICSDPALLMLSIGKKPSGDEQGVRKDTCINIEQRKKFVVHIAGSQQISPLNESAVTLNHGESELDRLGLETTELEGFSLPRLSCCAVAMGCELYRLDEIGHTPQAIVYGEIKTLYIDDSIIDKDSQRLIIKPEKLDPLARLGGANYSSLGDKLSAQRPK